MKKAKVLLALVLALSLALVCFVPALAGSGTGSGSGGGTSPLSLVSVTSGGKTLEGAVLAPDAVITVTFDRGMTDNLAANAQQFKLLLGTAEVAAAVAQGSSKEIYTVTPKAALAAGSYTFVVGKDVKANNGNTLGADKSFAFTVAASAVPRPADTPKAGACVVSAWTLQVNGKTFDCQGYNIDGSNYFMLRDVALALKDTANKFSVEWDAAKNLVTAVSGGAYAASGSECQKGTDNSASCQPSAQAALFNGAASTAYCYNIGGNNYFKLRDLAAAFGFAVDYDAASFTVTVASTDYKPAA